MIIFWLFKKNFYLKLVFYRYKILSLLFAFLYLFFAYFCLRQGFSVEPQLPWKSCHRLGGPRTRRSACLCLPSSGMNGMHPHLPALNCSTFNLCISLTLKWIMESLFWINFSLCSQSTSRSSYLHFMCWYKRACTTDYLHPQLVFLLFFQINYFHLRFPNS